MNEHVLELQIDVCGGDYSWYVTDRFPARPDLATIQLLKQEATVTFRALYDLEPDEIRINLVWLAREERELESQPVRP